MVFYGTEKITIAKYAFIYEMNPKDIGVQKMDIHTIECLKDSNEESFESDKSDSSDEDIVPDIITITGNAIDVTNKKEIKVVDLLDHLDCNNKFIIFNSRSGEDGTPVSDNIVSFVDNSTDFHDMVMNLCNNYAGSSIEVCYKSHSSTSCFIVVYCSHSRPFVEHYQIFGVNKIHQEQIRKSIKKSLKGMESSCKLEDY